jgi:NAD(P)-dependent dehydrogenase (short-subunit alcohol dehydrogenase family)
VAKPRSLNAANNNGAMPLGIASFSGHADAAKLLRAAGANVNAALRNFCSSVRYAMSENSLRTVGWLPGIAVTYELSRRLAGSTITANCFSPGPTLTRLGDNMRGLPAAVPWLLKEIPF